MKQYFAKYLPVEGEIKEGDFYYNTIDNIYGRLINYTKGFEDECRQYYSKNCKKVKLFLCSKDIQVGDEYVFEGVISKHYPKFTCKENKLDNNGFFEGKDPKDCFIAIGEISAKANWIKNGDSFEEDEILRNVRVREFDCEADEYEYDTRKVSPASAKPTILKTEELIREEILIRCPTCKTFH